MTGGWGRVARDELRAMTVDANDGIIATAGIIEGLTGAGAGYRTLVIAALSAVICGAAALAGVKYTEAAVERDAHRALIVDEERQLSTEPEEELAELTEYYRRLGLTEPLATEVAAQLTAADALAAHVRAEHGVDLIDTVSPVRASVLAGLSFALGSAVPLVAALLAADRVRIWVTFLAVVLSLCLTSVVVARSDRIRPRSVLLRTLTIGIVTMLLGLAVGTLIGL